MSSRTSCDWESHAEVGRTDSQHQEGGGEPAQGEPQLLVHGLVSRAVANVCRLAELETELRDRLAIRQRAAMARQAAEVPPTLCSSHPSRAWGSVNGGAVPGLNLLSRYPAEGAPETGSWERLTPPLGTIHEVPPTFCPTSLIRQKSLQLVPEPDNVMAQNVEPQQALQVRSRGSKHNSKPDC
mmetsp:Transcript_13191/g.23233  ORF Transcript_13191/g.23233 Transcript_13191/m.23233 type:complete len:183 (-) Transcript_13191:2067-2615(-)